MLFVHHCACFKGWKCMCVGWALSEMSTNALIVSTSMASFSPRWQIHITLLRQKAGLLTCFSSRSAEHPYFWHFYSYTETHHPSATSKSYHLDFTIYSRRLTGVLYEILPKLPLFLLQIQWPMVVFIVSGGVGIFAEDLKNFHIFRLAGNKASL